MWESEGGERHEEDQTRKGGQGRVGPHAEVYISFLSFPLPLVWPYPRRSAWLVAGVGGVVVCRARSEQQQPTGHCSSARKRSQGLQEGPVGLRLAGWPGGALARGSNPPRAGPRSHKRGEKARGGGVGEAVRPDGRLGEGLEGSLGPFEGFGGEGRQSQGEGGKGSLGRGASEPPQGQHAPRPLVYRVL